MANAKQYHRLASKNKNTSERTQKTQNTTCIWMNEREKKDM